MKKPNHRLPSGGILIVGVLSFASAACADRDRTDPTPNEVGSGTTLDAVTTSEPPVVVPTPARVVSVASQQADDLDASRSTAIVRAANRIAPAVVSISVIRQQQRRQSSFFDDFFFGSPRARQTLGFGSGFLVRADGYVITNDHVIVGAEQIRVSLADGRDFPAELVGSDPMVDVAVLKIEGADLPVATLGTSEGLLIGEWALAVGNPLANFMADAEPTVTAGVISAVNRSLVPGSNDEAFYLGMIQTDASVNPGNSGGPLVNALGEVIGVNSSIFSRGGGSEGLGFAIPIDRALRVAEDLITSGEIRRAWLGVDVEASEQDVWGRTSGVVVSRVAEGSPAERAGVSVGTRLMAASGRRLLTPLDYEAVMLDLRAGESVLLEVEHRTEPVLLTATDLPSITADRVTALDRMELISVNSSIQAERELRYSAGALIVAMDPELTRQLSLREGDVLLQINRTRIESAEQAAEILRRVEGRIQLYYERNGAVSVHQILLRRNGV